MINPALDNELPRPHRPLVAVVKPQHDLAAQDNSVVHAQRPMHRHREVARNIGNTKDDAAGGAPRDRLRELSYYLLVVHWHCSASVEYGER